MTDDIIAFKGEIFLLSWSESHKGGRTGVFLFDDESPEHPLKKFTTRKGKRAGQRFACVLVEIADDETPVKQKGGSLSQQAAMMCENERFQEFIRVKYRYSYQPGQSGSSYAAAGLRYMHGIQSRSELDHNPEAAKRFHELMREFNAWCEQ